MKNEQEILLLEKEIATLKTCNHELQGQLKLLQEQIAMLKKLAFGKKSERFVPNNGQLFFPGFEVEAGIKQVEEEVFVPEHKKKKSKPITLNNISFPEDLPVETVVLDITEEEKIDPKTGLPLVCIGEELTRKLGKKAEQFFIKEIIRKKYATVGKPEEGIKIADLPDSLINRCSVDESIIADVITKKFCDHLPLYRQAEMLQRNQIKISRQTLSSYVQAVGKALLPLYHLLEQEIRASGNIFVDETPIDMLCPGTGKTKQCYMVTMVGGASLDPPLRIYRFFTSRKHEEFEKFFGDYIGVFHSDKYAAYEKKSQAKEVIWCPCWSHIRRKYVEAELGDTKFREAVLLAIQELFAIEERGKSLSSEERVALRKAEALPIIDLLIKSNTRQIELVLPKSKLGQAIRYFLSLAPHIKNYIEHPNARLDNNVAERSLKLVVIGRKNWLFVGNEGGGEAAAVIYSLAQTCRALKINPYDYFEDVFRRIQGHSFAKLRELLPQNWKK